MSLGFFFVPASAEWFPFPILSREISAALPLFLPPLEVQASSRATLPFFQVSAVARIKSLHPRDSTKIVMAVPFILKEKDGE